LRALEKKEKRTDPNGLTVSPETRKVSGNMDEGQENNECNATLRCNLKKVRVGLIDESKKGRRGEKGRSHNTTG